MQTTTIFEGFRPLIDPSRTVQMSIHGHRYTLAPLHDCFVAITAGSHEGEILDVFRVEQAEIADTKRLALTAVSHLGFAPVVGVAT